MSKSILIRGGLAVVALCLAGVGGWLFSLPSATAEAPAPPVPREEADAVVAALRPKRGAHPVIAVIGINEGTETTDYLVPTGILRRADLAEVLMLATGRGPVQLYPALAVEPDATTTEFDAAHPHGADYVIVPAMSRDDDPAVLSWLQSQSRKGATIIGVCVGAKVVAAAGLLDGRRATTHWYAVRALLERSPRSIEYVADRRFVLDDHVVTTTGITASIPMMLTLIEAIGGQTKAISVARDLGIEEWDARHASGAFKLTRAFATTVLLNRLAFWNRDEFAIRLEPGMDEVSLALVADAWSRTYRSNAVTFAASTSTVETANGIRVSPDHAKRDWPEELRLSTFPGSPVAEALDQSLRAIAKRYGERTRDVVAMQLEYPR